MSMKKRLLSLVLCLVMVFSLFPSFLMNAAASYGEGYRTADGTYSPADRKISLYHFNNNNSFNIFGIWTFRHTNVFGNISVTVTNGRIASYEIGWSKTVDEGSD